MTTDPDPTLDPDPTPDPTPDPEQADEPTPDPETGDPQADPDPDPDPEPEPDPDTFPREYVEELRSEAATHRKAARDAAERVAALEGEVWALRVAATGRLADPADLPLPEDGLDADVDQAVAALLEAKPHLAARRARGRVGQGEPSRPNAPSLADMLRAGA